MTLSAPPAAVPASSGASAGASDEALVQRARAGEAAAFEELARRHRRPAYLLAVQLLGNPEDALDATQDALLAFYNTLARFDGDRPVRPWLFSIVRNRCRDLLRRRRVRRSEPLAGEDGETWRPELVDTSADPHRDALRHDLRQRIWAALGGLAPEHREIVVLRDYQDLSYAEIADVLAIPQGTVMSRLHRARKQLAAALAHLAPHAGGRTS